MVIHGQTALWESVYQCEHTVTNMTHWTTDCTPDLLALTSVMHMITNPQCILSKSSGKTFQKSGSYYNSKWRLNLKRFGQKACILLAVVLSVLVRILAITSYENKGRVLILAIFHNVSKQSPFVEAEERGKKSRKV